MASADLAFITPAARVRTQTRMGDTWSPLRKHHLSASSNPQASSCGPQAVAAGAACAASLLVCCSRFRREARPRRSARRTAGVDTAITTNVQSTSMKVIKPENIDLDEVEGQFCSIWRDEKYVAIPESLQKQPWGPLMDLVETIGKSKVRGCTKGAKQVATLGPASSSPEMIERLFLCGVDVFRLNFSHGEHSEKAELVNRIRQVENAYMHPVCILADMQGPKQRCGKFKNDAGVELVARQSFRFDLLPELGDEQRATLPHPEILLALTPGKTLLLDDGKIRMRVEKSGYIQDGKEVVVQAGQTRPGDVTACVPFVDCIVEVGGRLKAKKGVNTPDVILPISPITEKDAKDIEFACSIGVDWIAMSFVQKHEDMEELRRRVAQCGGPQPKILAKIEKPSAVEDAELTKILEVSDGVMVARGDLGVEMNPETVPFVQKDIIAKATAIGKPVIVATQMLESMINCPTPTRAECSDVANAILDGCDAVMLSGESAVGEYPLECVEMQRRLIVTAEKQLRGGAGHSHRSDEGVQEMTQSHAILASAASLAKGMNARAIICFTATGQSVRQLTQLRPSVPILAICPCLETARWLTLLRGVYATSDPDVQKLASKVASHGPLSVRFSEPLEVACRLARERGLATDSSGNLVVVARMPLFRIGPLNTIRLTQARGPDELQESSNDW